MEISAISLLEYGKGETGVMSTEEVIGKGQSHLNNPIQNMQESLPISRYSEICLCFLWKTVIISLKAQLILPFNFWEARFSTTLQLGVIDMIQQVSGMEALQMPEQVHQQAALFHLGTLNNVYRPRIASPLLVIGIALGIILADAVLFGVILLLGYIISVLIIVPIFAIIYAIYGLRSCNLRVYEFSNGLLRAKGKQIDVIRWDQIGSVMQASKASNTSYMVGGVLGALLFGSRKHVYTIQRQDGQIFKFESSNIHNIESLGQTIQQEVAQAHLPMAIAAYDNGNVIPFGPLSVSLQGIVNAKGVILPWSQVNGVTVNQNVVTIMQSGRVQKWVSAPLAKVPNIGVLTELVNYARQNAR